MTATQPELFPPAPENDDAQDELYTCPHCGNVADLDHYDVMGCDDGHLICVECGEDFEMGREGT